MKKILILGGGGFIGGHLAKKLKDIGNYVRVCDIKNHEYFNNTDISDDFILGDLTDINVVKDVIDINSGFDEVYQLAADMGGANYIFTGDNDANIMHNSASINLHIANESIKHNVKKIFYSSSACMYPEHNQIDPANPNCSEDSAYPANPDSEYGWEKLFSERLYMAYHRNYELNIRIARFHNIFGTNGTWKGGKEKAPAAICRKVAEALDGDSIEIIGDGLQTRSFLYIDDCLEAILRLMEVDYHKPLNIGSTEMISINSLAKMIISISNKNMKIDNIWGDEFFKKYNYKCPVGVRGRNSDNKLYKEIVGWEVNKPLIYGIEKTFAFINNQINK